MHYFSVSSVKPGNKDNRGATGNDAIAIGPESTAGDYAVALGNKAIASHAGSIAVGSENKAEARDGITIGRFASTNGADNSQSIAIGGGNYPNAEQMQQAINLLPLVEILMPRVTPLLLLVVTM